MNNQVTVLYYTSNTEPEPFASRVRDNILKYKGDLPLISVSQKPLENFGHNICVGEHDNCYNNEFRQIQIGLREIKTPFVLHVEADFLYPPDYFNFTPTELKPYFYDNVWVAYYKGKQNYVGNFHFKWHSIGAMMCPTQDWLERITNAFVDIPEWSTKETKRCSTHTVYPDNFKYVWTGNPAISFKTGYGVNSNTSMPKKLPKRSLPFWGNAAELKRTMFE
jgi:hypothetical protein